MHGSAALARLIRRYPLVAAVLVGGAVTGVLALVGLLVAARVVGTGVALVIAGIELVTMIRHLGSGRWGLDVLAILAIVSTAVFGDYAASLVVALMMTGGAALEDYAEHRARARLQDLLARAPRTATRRTDHGDELIAVGDVVVGDVVVVHPGEVLPVDGILLEGDAELDESSLTGESLPVTREAGSAVLSGAVNGSSPILVRATATAQQSQYQQIIDLVASASESRAPFVRLADRVSIPFTLVALLIAAVAWIVSGDAVRFGEVLVVATPCPLLIAAPVAIVAGMGRAARDGAVVKSGESLERLSRAVTVAFDKTGTLTSGQPEVVEVDAGPGTTETEILGVAAGLESGSGHVLAAAITEAAHTRQAPVAEVTDVSEETAHGMRGLWEGREVVVGKASFAGAEAGALEPGEMAVHVAISGAPVGRIVLRDEVRPEAEATVERLRAAGVREVLMVTGDSEATARHVAADTGIGDVHAGLLPAQKVAVIAEASGRPVVMVGDGVNDAPVLAAADVGIAMGARGATAASESADVVVLVDDVSRVADLVETAQRTMRIARQSIVIGIGLSVVFMIVAATGVLPAIAGALIQEAIDVATILNGLRAGRRAASARMAP